MSAYDKIAWLPLCGGLTGVGLVLSYLACGVAVSVPACAERPGRCCRWPPT